MKKIFFTLMLIFPILANAQIGESIFSITDDGEIITKSKFLNSFSKRVDPGGIAFLDSIQVQLASSAYTVKPGRYNYEYGCRDNDPGDYDVIEISKNGEQVLLFKQGDVLAKYSDKEYKEYKENDYFITAPLSDSSKVLIFQGYYYPSGQPYLIIIVLTESDAKLVYYKEMSFGVRMTPDSFSMSLESRWAEWSYDRKTIERPAVTHTIWRENGVLKFKDD